MGMIANYQYLSDNELSQIKRYSCQEEDLLDLVEDYPEENDTLIDVDKMWDAFERSYLGSNSFRKCVRLYSLY